MNTPTFTTRIRISDETTEWNKRLAYLEELIVGVEVHKSLSKTEVRQQDQEDPFQDIRQVLQLELRYRQDFHREKRSDTCIKKAYL